MALFGAKDASLSLLTRLYQTDVPDIANPVGSELDQHLYHVLNSYNADGLYSDTENFKETPREKNQLYLMAQLIPLVRRIMDYMAATPPLDPIAPDVTENTPYWERQSKSYIEFTENIGLLSKYASAIVPKLLTYNPEHHLFKVDQPVFFFYGDVEGHTSNAILLLENFGYSRTAVLGELIDSLKRGRSSFRRCITCGNPFISMRADHVRCSKRCNDRSSARRKKIVASEKESVLSKPNI